ncbi:MAG: hypothetical protein OXG38_12275 [Chloroflexi bacterium]|nr:hypothetical protein [Chloroflexota bacterium]
MRRLTVLLVALAAVLAVACGGDDRSAEVERLQADVEALRAQVNVLTRELEIAQDARGELAREMDDLKDARDESARENAAAAGAAAEAKAAVESAAEAAAAAAAEAAARVAAEAVEDAERRVGESLDAALADVEAAMVLVAELSGIVDALADEAAWREAALQELWFALDEVHARLDALPSAPLGPYFDQLQRLAQDTDAIAQDILAAWNRDMDGGDLSAAKEHFQDLVALEAEYADALAALDPPPELARRHGAFLESAQDFAAALVEFEDAVAQAGTIEEYRVAVDAYGESDAFEAVYRRRGDACFQLQDGAADFGVTVDLRCVSI